MIDSPRWLAVIETSGNQAYIFDSNRLSQVAGGSYLLSKVTKQQVEEGLRAGRYPGVTPVVVSSGLLVLEASTREQGATVVEDISRAAIQHAPGLQVTGVIVEMGDDPMQTLDNAFRELHQHQATLRGARSRFRMWPIFEPCAQGPGPAVTVAGKKAEPLGVVAEARRRSSDEGFRASKQLVGGRGVRSIEELDQKLEQEGADRWIGVIHADGNGIGQIVQDFAAHLQRPEIGRAGVEDIFEHYAAWSRELEDITRQVLAETADAVVDEAGTDQVAMLPVLVGGDDVNMIIEGRVAIQFARTLCEKFTEACAASHYNRGVTMSAGVALTKPHFPFHAGYRLAEELASRAKAHGQGRAVIDWHMVYDTSPPDLASKERTLDRGMPAPVALGADAPEGCVTWNDLAAFTGKMAGLSGSERAKLRAGLYTADASEFWKARVLASKEVRSVLDGDDPFRNYGPMFLKALDLIELGVARKGGRQ